MSTITASTAVATPQVTADSVTAPARPESKGRGLVYVPCNHCGREVTTGVHNVSRLVRCVGCGLVYVNPRPALEELERRYERSYFHNSDPTFGGYEDYEGDAKDILRTFRRRMPSLARHLGGANPRLLDVGCATGAFLEVAREAGWRGEGVDISEYALSRAQEKGFDVHRGTLPGVLLPAESYDLLTLWDVIEHVPDPTATLAECRRALRPGGILAISTPDAGSLLARVLRGRWLGFRSLDEHLYFFSRRTLSAMLAEAGFEVREIRSAGKYLTLARLVERLRFYTRIGAVLLRTADRAMPDLSIYVDPRDTMLAVAARVR